MTVLPARAGYARSAATRAAYDPRKKAQPALLYAISRIARSGATRSNYTNGVGYITIKGIQVGGSGSAAPGQPRILHDTLVITDTLNEVPTTARMTLHFGNPHVGDPVVITIGTMNNLRKEFTGTILRCRSYYIDTPQNPHFDLDCIDDTEGMDKRHLYARFVNATVKSIATGLVGSYASSYLLQVDATIGAIVIDQISFADRTLSDALTQLMKRAGSNWKCGNDKTIYIGPDGGPDPQVLNAVHPSLLTIDVTRDYSQVITRVLSEGGGGQLLTQVLPAETILPLDTAVWYEPSGEVTIADQRLSYTAVDLGGAGSLVGPGAAPTGLVTLALASGAGVTSGSHYYAVTFVTAAGESLPGPANLITVGAVAPPSAAPSAGAPQGGNGPDVGTHQYAISFVTASGETPPGPTVSVTTTAITPPTVAPTANGPTGGGSIDVGFHDYAVTYVTPTGETTPSPIGNGIQTVAGSGMVSPPAAPTATATAGTGLSDGTYQYAATIVNNNGETTAGATVSVVTSSVPPGVLSPPGAPSASAIAGTGLSDGTYQYGVTVVNGNGETTLGATTAVATSSVPTTVVPPPSGGISINANFGGPYKNGDLLDYSQTWLNANGETVAGPTTRYTVTADNIYTYFPGAITFPSGVTAARLYRLFKGAWAVQQINANGTFLADDGGHFSGSSGPPATNGATIPGSNTDRVQLTVAAVSGLTRRIYRTAVNGGAFKLLTSLSGGTTSFTDSTPDASLGGAPPGSNTATTPGSNTDRVQVTVADAGGWTRRLYRTTVNGSALKLVTTLAAGSTSYLDATPDGSLGVAPPSSNNSGTNQQTITLTAIPAPGYQRRLYRRSGGAGLRALVTLDTVATSYTDATANSGLGAAPPGTNTAVACQVPLTLPIGGALVTGRKMWGTAAGQSQLKLLGLVGDNTTTSWLITTPDSGLGANAPTGNTAAANQVLVSTILLGGAGVTARKLYRTAADQPQLKFLATIGDNTTTSYTDALADASLGANAPTGDTSGLQQPAGVISQGSTSMPVASVAPFRTGGGWAVIGNGEQVIRYTGRSGNTLTGIPASGNGSIIATIAYNSTITAAALLIGLPTTGARALNFTVQRGDAVNLLVAEDDTAAQSALAKLIGGDGIQEDSLSDNRLSAKEARARARAWLNVRKDVEVSVRAVTRDRNNASGRTLTVNLGVFELYGVPFTIQTVTIDTFTPSLQPHYTIAASSVRFTFEDWQRMLKEGT